MKKANNEIKGISIKFAEDSDVTKMISTIIEENASIISYIISESIKSSDNNDVKNDLNKVVLNSIPEFISRNPKYAPSSIRLCLTKIQNCTNIDSIKNDIIPVLINSLNIVLKEYL